MRKDIDYGSENMEEFVKQLTLVLLSEPLILVLVIIGGLGLIYSLITNAKSYIINIILIGFIISLSGGLGKRIQLLALILAIILIIIFCIFFVLIKNKNKREINTTIKYDSKEDNICPQCGGSLKERTGKYGNFFGCSNYPKCKFVRKMNENKNIIVNVNITEDKSIESVKIDSDEKCPQCSGKLILKTGKYGEFYGCSNYPKCKYTKKVVNYN